MAGPKYDLVLVDRSNSKNKTLAGVAFEKDGFLSIALKPGIVISWKDDIWINLSPRTEFPYISRTDSRAEGSASAEPGTPNLDDNDF